MKRILTIAFWGFVLVAAIPIIAACGVEVAAGGVVSDKWIGVATLLMLLFVIGTGGAVLTGAIWFTLWAMSVSVPSSSSQSRVLQPIQLRVCRRLCISSTILIAVTLGLYGLKQLYDIYHADEMLGVTNPFLARRPNWRLIAAATSPLVPVFFGVLWGVTAHRWRWIRAGLARSVAAPDVQ